MLLYNVAKRHNLYCTGGIFGNNACVLFVVVGACDVFYQATVDNNKIPIGGCELLSATLHGGIIFKRVVCVIWTCEMNVHRTRYIASLRTYFISSSNLMRRS